MILSHNELSYFAYYKFKHIYLVKYNFKICNALQQLLHESILIARSTYKEGWSNSLDPGIHKPRIKRSKFFMNPLPAPKIINFVYITISTF